MMSESHINAFNLHLSTVPQNGYNFHSENWFNSQQHQIYDQHIQVYNFAWRHKIWKESMFSRNNVQELTVNCQDEKNRGDQKRSDASNIPQGLQYAALKGWSNYWKTPESDVRHFLLQPWSSSASMSWKQKRETNLPRQPAPASGRLRYV